MAQKFGTGKILLESEFYLCLLFSHPLIGLYADWKNTGTERRGKEESALPSISLHVRMNLTTCKEKTREKGMLDGQGTHYPCEGSFFLTSLLIINCSSLSAASLCQLGLSFLSRQ